MKIENYKYPESSFLSSEKDLEIIVNYLFKNENLKKLLYYNSKDCLKKPKVSDEKLVEMFGKNIKIVPKLTVDNDVLTYIVVSFDSFTPSDNPEFRDNIIEFLKFSESRRDLFFLVTPVGTGLAGQNVKEIAEVFYSFLDPTMDNVVFTSSWFEKNWWD